MNQLRPGTRYKGEREVITSRVPKGLKPRIQAIARARDTGMSDLISEVLEEWVPQAEVEEGLPQQGTFEFDTERTA